VLLLIKKQYCTLGIVLNCIAHMLFFTGKTTQQGLTLSAR